MKKLYSFLILACAMGVTMMVVTSCSTPTQVTETYMAENTQARALDVTANGFAKPMCADVLVDEAAGPQVWISDNAGKPISQAFFEKAMNKDIRNIQSWGVFQATVSWDCDIVVAPTFHFYTNAHGGYTLEVRGYKGHFKNWKPASDKDLELSGDAKLITTADLLKAGMELKTVQAAPAAAPTTPMTYKQKVEAEKASRAAAATGAAAATIAGTAAKILLR